MNLWLGLGCIWAFVPHAGQQPPLFAVALEASLGIPLCNTQCCPEGLVWLAKFGNFGAMCQKVASMGTPLLSHVQSLLAVTLANPCGIGALICIHMLLNPCLHLLSAIPVPTQSAMKA